MTNQDGRPDALLATQVDELRHRLRNHLQNMISLISMQIRRARNEETIAALEDLRARFASITSIYIDLDDSSDHPVALEKFVPDLVRRIGDLLDACPPGPLRVLHVGGAGLTLPRYVAARRPGSRQVVLEPDEALTELVRERLPLPWRSGISVRPVTGRDGLAAVRDGWAEAVVVDAFAGAEVPLRMKEFDLLSVLVRNAGKALSRERLMAEVWDDNWTGSTKTLDMHVLSLRRKLAAAGLPGDPVTTLRGYGYRYERT